MATTRTLGAGESASSASSVSAAVIPGISTSRITTSGCSLAARSTAGEAVSASPPAVIPVLPAARVSAAGVPPGGESAGRRAVLGLADDEHLLVRREHLPEA